MKIKVFAKAGKLYKANSKDSGFDLRSAEDVSIKGMSRELVSTGIHLDMRFVEFPISGIGIEGEVRPRSGNALKKGLTVLNTPGTIDEHYTNEVGVILYNTTNIIINIKKGDRIAQLVFSPVFNEIEIEYVDKIFVDVDETIRGLKGFGSSGVK